MRQGLSLSAISAVLILLGTSPLNAQGLVRGTILDNATGETIPDVEVQLLDSRERLLRAVISDAAGAFVFPAPRAGAVRFRASRIGFKATTTPPLRLVQDDTVEIEIRLDTEAILLAPLEVTARSARRRNPVLDGFHYRMERGFGNFITRQDIERRNAFYVSDVLTTVPGVRLGPSSGRGGRTIYMSRTIQRGECPVQIYVDGFLINRRLSVSAAADTIPNSARYAHNLEFTLDEVVSPSAVEGIEVYRGLSEVPAEFGGHDARCGVIAVWTRRGAQ